MGAMTMDFSCFFIVFSYNSYWLSLILRDLKDRIKRIYASTGCSINLSHRVDGFQDAMPRVEAIEARSAS